MEARGEESDGGREEIILRKDESGGEKTTVRLAWVSGEGNEDREGESLMKLSTEDRKYVDSLFS